MATGVHKQTEQTTTADAPPSSRRVDVALFARWLLAGFLAGASGLFVLLLLLVLLLAIGAFWPLLYEISAGLRGELPFWETLGQSAGPSLSNLPAFLWSARVGILAIGLLGLLLAAADILGSRIDRPWRHLSSLVALLGLVGTIVFALQYANREQMLVVFAEQPGLVNLRESALVSDLAALTIGALIALPTTYVIWALWHWWYLRWSRWLGLGSRGDTPAAEPSAPGDDWRAYQLRLHRAKRNLSEEQAADAAAVRSDRANTRLMRVFLVVLALLVAVLLGAVRLYNSAGSQIASDDLWVSTTSPEAQATLMFTRVPRRMIAAGISGAGVADISFGSAQASTPLRQAAGIHLADLGANFPSASVDLAGLEPGRYWLKASLREGNGGQLRYTLLQGGGALAQLAAWLIGLAAGVALALVALVALEALALRGWGQSRSIGAG